MLEAGHSLGGRDWKWMRSDLSAGIIRKSMHKLWLSRQTGAAGNVDFNELDELVYLFKKVDRPALPRKALPTPFVFHRPEAGDGTVYEVIYEEDKERPPQKTPVKTSNQQQQSQVLEFEELVYTQHNIEGQLDRDAQRLMDLEESNNALQGINMQHNRIELGDGSQSEVDQLSSPVLTTRVDGQRASNSNSNVVRRIRSPGPASASGAQRVQDRTRPSASQPSALARPFVPPTRTTLPPPTAGSVPVNRPGGTSSQRPNAVPPSRPSTSAPTTRPAVRDPAVPLEQPLTVPKAKRRRIFAETDAVQVRINNDNLLTAVTVAEKKALTAVYDLQAQQLREDKIRKDQLHAQEAERKGQLHFLEVQRQEREMEMDLQQKAERHEMEMRLYQAKIDRERSQMM